MKKLKFICAQPVDKYFIWQVHIWLESLKTLNKDKEANVLVYVPFDREAEIDNWSKIKELYPNTEFFFYIDSKREIDNVIPIYIPILRPFILSKYFELHPELKECAIFYCDSDIIFTEKFDISAYTQDDICYLSDTNSYINADYFDSKIKDVKPEKLEKYKTRDILNEITTIIGISRDVAAKYNNHSGGAQYLLKNVDAEFWKKVMRDCIIIRQYLQNINRAFFESENKGFQSWCADMWAVLWNIWAQNKETRVIPEMDFAWSSDNISKLETKTILHNAGIVGETQGDIPTFFKGKYHSGMSPFEDKHLEVVLNNEKSKTLCNNFYVQKMMEIKIKYNLTY